MQFKNIKNQHVLINHLTEIIDAGRVSHAQLFLGETQSGSLALAIAYMQYLCCTNRQHYHEDADHQYHTHDGSTTLLRADSCGTCPSCAKFEALMHSDLHFVFPNIISKSSYKPSSEDFQTEFIDFLNKYSQYGTLNQWYEELSVENKQGMIREQDSANIVNYISMTTYEAPYKMVIVWCADKMNISAANELLKTLEEPTGKTIIILVAESTERLLKTIISRTQEVRIPSLPDTDNSHNHNEVYAPLFVSWMRMLFKLNMARLSELVDQVAKMGREPQKEFLLYCMESLRECLLRNVTQNAFKPSIDFGDDKFNQSFYAVITPRNISLMNEALNHTLMAIERNASPALAFMALSFKMSSYISKK